MKASILKIVGVTALCVALSAAAETLVQETSNIQPVPWNQVPAFGTFWVQGPNGLTPVPYPCRPQYVAGETVYAMGDGQFFVDARNVKNFGLLTTAMASPAAPQRFGPLDPAPADKPLLVTSNKWFNQIIISNHTCVSLDNATFDFNGNLIAHQFPFGVMYAVTATNLTTPMAQWQPVGQTNVIANSDTPNNTDIFDWLTYFTLFATENNGSTFNLTLDQAVSQANQNAPGSGSNGVLWSGEQGVALDALSQ